jgi:hypothetical protein
VQEVFDSINPGMSCAEVEATLGKPVLRYCTVVPPRVGDDEAWYLPPPEIGPFDAPWGPGTICVVYSVDNTVVAKRLNPQWRAPETLANKSLQSNGAARRACRGHSRKDVWRVL